ncbi:FG-GAP-like repeat-containing protein [Larkinella ripae]
MLLANGSGGFGEATNFPADNQPDAIAVGDFNGDGRDDLVVANISSNNVSVLLGNGSGGFGEATNIPVGIAPSSVAVGDFNGDGRADLAIAIAYENVAVLLGNGSGGFGAPATFSIGTTANSVTVGDFNGDGRADLVVANFPNSGTISVLLGNGNGDFGAATRFRVSAVPESVAVGDLNGDGRLDLVTANNNSGTISVLLGDGSGGFGEATLYFIGNADEIVIGDFNGDGRPDLAGANSGGHTISVLMANAYGGFRAPKHFPVTGSPRSIVKGDFNGDGWVDLATANTISNVVSVLINCGSNRSPVVTGTQVTIPQSATVSVPFSVSVASAVTDPDGDVLTFSAEGLPPGLSIDPVSGIVSGTPSTTVGSPFTVTLRATDPQGASISLTGRFPVVNPSGGAARLSVNLEPAHRLQVNLLGNPVRQAIEVEVTGVETSLLQLSLTDMTGRIIGQRCTERAGPSEQYRFDVSTIPPGILFLRASSGVQSQTVRILKVN